MSPFKGQGANQALLDALSLARLISLECDPDSKWRKMGLRETVLTKFEKEMLERSKAKVQGSEEAARLLHLRPLCVSTLFYLMNISAYTSLIWLTKD